MPINPQQIKFICATEADLDVASSILTEAAHWRMERNIPIWRPEHFTIDLLKPFVERNEMYLAQYEGEAIGLLYFQWEDQRFWPDVPAGESGFLHRIAIRRRVAGQGVLNEMIRWAGEKVKRAGRRYLRLDCDATTTRLCAHYESLGFKLHNIILIEKTSTGPYQMAQYQIDLLADTR